MSDSANLCAALVVGTYSHGVLQQQCWYVASCISIALHMQSHGKAGFIWVRHVSVAQTLAAETMLYSGRVLSTFVCHQKTGTCAECLRLLVAREALTHVQH